MVSIAILTSAKARPLLESAFLASGSQGQLGWALSEAIQVDLIVSFQHFMDRNNQDIPDVCRIPVSPDHLCLSLVTRDESLNTSAQGHL